jgi:hypothetical protein
MSATSSSTFSSWWDQFSGWLIAKWGPSLLPYYSSSSLLLRLEDDITSKTDRIEACLSSQNDSVDLWELRELALSKGGLMSREYE